MDDSKFTRSSDTGINYTHPFLGGGIGQGYKVISGFDFVGDAYNGVYFIICFGLEKG